MHESSLLLAEARLRRDNQRRSARAASRAPQAADDDESDSGNMPTILSTAVSLPPATRALTVALVACTLLFTLLRLSVSPKDLRNLLGASGDSSLLFPWLVLVPDNVLYAPWTLLVAAFVEVNLVEFVISILTLPLAARYLERVWGPVELLKFVGVTVVASNAIAVAVNVIEATALDQSALFLCVRPGALD